MLERRTRNVKVATADIVDGFVVNEERAVRVLDCGVGRENGIVWLDDCGRDSWSWVDGEFELGFLAVVGGEALEEEGAESRAGSSAEGVEDQETLEGGAVVLFLALVPTHSKKCSPNFILEFGFCSPKLGESCPKYHPKFPFQLYSDHERSCWPHPPFH